MSIRGLIKNRLKSPWSFLISIILSVPVIGHSQATGEVMEYASMCDASAGLAVDSVHFIVVNDEDNILRIFHIGQSSPVLSFDLSEFLGIEYDDKSPEVDLEGAARWGDYYFFISSHGRDKKGRFRENRCRFFAVKIDTSDGFVIQPVGSSYRRLIDDLLHSPEVKKTGLMDVYLPKVKKNAELAPKIRGVNVEGLTATPDGELLIGFRNPRPKGQAIVVTLKNPLDILLKGDRAKFDPPILLELGGLGIRSMEFVTKLERYLIIAGAHDSSERSRFYTWAGDGSRPELFEGVRLPKNWNPETLIYYPSVSKLQILSDDGTQPSRNSVGEPCVCKDLDDQQLKKYRGTVISLEH